MGYFDCYFDGSFNGKRMAIGCIIYNQDGENVYQVSELVPGTGSSNYAEYCACIKVLRWLNERDFKKAYVSGDSKLVINQLLGIWKIKEGIYVSKAYEAKELLDKLNNVHMRWIRRSRNVEADKLSKYE